MVQLAITIVIIAALGIVTFFLVGRRPDFFWPFLIALPLVFAGFMIAGRAVADEYFLAAVVAGGFLAVRRGLVPHRADKKTSLHWWVFLFTVLYFVLQSLRGMIVLEDIRILRWVGYFLLFGALLLLTRRWQFPIPKVLSVAKVTGLASSVYFGGYLLFGLFNECIKGTVRWDLQGKIWAGSSYAIFPIIFSIPAALLLLKSEDKNSRRLGWLTLFASILSVGYYESRVGWLVIIATILFIPLILNLRRGAFVILGTILISGFALFYSLGVFAKPYCHTFLSGNETAAQASERLFDFKRYKPGFKNFPRAITETVIDPISPRITDVDRSLHLKSGFVTATETPLKFLIGGGADAHSSLLYPNLSELYQSEFPGIEISKEVHTIGLVAIIVDFGILGLILIFLNLFLSIKNLVSISEVNWKKISIFVFMLILIPFWLSVTNLQDMVIYFLLLMPENIFTFLSRES